MSPSTNNNSQFANAAQGYVTNVPIQYVSNQYLQQQQQNAPQQSFQATDNSGNFMSPNNIASNAGKFFKDPSGNINKLTSFGNKVDAFGSKYLGFNSGSSPFSTLASDFGTTSGAENLGMTGINSASNAGSFLPANFSSSMQLGSSSGNIAGQAVSSGANAGGFLGSSSTFSEALGSAGIGATIGNFMSKLTGGNTTGSTIGGGLGGALGGMYLGAELGSVVPGIGTAIGAVAGSLLGGMFGGGKPHPASMGMSFNLQPDGTIKDLGVGSKHLSDDTARTMSDDFSNYLKAMGENYGVNYKGITAVRVGTDTGYYGSPGTIVLSTDPNFSSDRGLQGIKQSNDTTKVINFDPADQKSIQSAYNDAFKYAASVSGADVNSLQAKNSQLAEQNGAPNITIPDKKSSFADYMQVYKGQ